MSATHYVLLSLIPYTEQNLKLVFLPSRFFADLDRIDNIKQNTARNAFYRSVKAGLIEYDDFGNARLTSKGMRKVAPFSAKKLPGASLMVVFDIPESERKKRDHLRSLLQELSFRQIQKSVWATDYDHKKLLKAEIEQYCLESYVQLFECRRI